jgi:hypothetical protein
MEDNSFTIDLSEEEEYLDDSREDDTHHLLTYSLDQNKKTWMTIKERLQDGYNREAETGHLLV